MVTGGEKDIEYDKVVNWRDWLIAIRARVKDLSDGLTGEETRVTNHNHTNWWLHKDPRNQPCCVCGITTKARQLEGVIDELLYRFHDLIAELNEMAEKDEDINMPSPQ